MSFPRRSRTVRASLSSSGCRTLPPDPRSRLPWNDDRRPTAAESAVARGRLHGAHPRKANPDLGGIFDARCQSDEWVWTGLGGGAPRAAGMESGWVTGVSAGGAPEVGDVACDSRPCCSPQGQRGAACTGQSPTSKARVATASILKAAVLGTQRCCHWLVSVRYTLMVANRT